MKSKQKRIQLIREAMIKVARILSGEGILITQAGDQPFVSYDDRTGKANRVNIPMLPDDASDTLIQATHGFLDHEVGHIMYTDYEYLKIASQAGCHTLFNIIEDTYVERMMQMEFTGSVANLSKSSIIFTSKYIDPIYEKMKREGCSDEKEWWNLIGAVAIRAISGQQHFIDYMSKDDKWKNIPNMMKILTGYKVKLQNVIASHESCEIAMDIMKVLKGEKPRLKTPEELESEPDEELEPKESDDSESDGESDDSKSDDSESDDSESDGEHFTALGERSKSSESDAEELKGARTEDEGPLITFRQDEINDVESTDQSMSKMIKELCGLEIGHNSSYIPYTREWDKVENHPIHDMYRPAWASDIENEVGHMTGTLAKNLERAFRAANRSRWESGKKSGRINGASLSRLLANDSRVMRTREVVQTKEVAVTLLIDCSGSMSGGKFDVAIKAAWSLAEVLSKLDINSEVLGFTSGNVDDDQRYLLDEYRNTKKRYSRVTPIYIPIFKSFSERFGNAPKARLASAHQKPNFLGVNIDGESLMYAADRLRKQREPGKILIVLSDGSPAGGGGDGNLSGHLSEVVQSLTREGINTVGIGINSGAVKSFYPKNVTLDEIEDLPKEVISRLREAILAR